MRKMGRGWCNWGNICYNRRMPRRIQSFCAIFAAALLLGGCGPAVFGAGVASGVIANDERTAGSIVEDETIEIKTRIALIDRFGDAVNVGVTSFNRAVLLTGQTPDANTRAQVVQIVRGVENVRSVHDKTIIGGPASLAARATDSLLTARVKAELCALQTEGFSCLQVKVVTENGVVYLLGLLTRENAALAVQTARNVKGVLKVVKVLQYRAADAG